ncbi:MAG: PepSY-associated TM helix domain-containing protein [Deltaproteobacteria bacterium]|nr:PepSY-associated TM helix domain-containing protein [Deltaproteobacteria bacterium]
MDEAGLARPSVWRTVAAWPWRRWWRAAHRDIGYFAVGLTLVYAVSGIAVNHIADWDPSFEQFKQTIQIDPFPGDDRAVTARALGELGVSETPTDVYRISDARVDITLERTTVHVNPEAGIIVAEGQRPRPVLRDINWLHLNRGKAAWTIFADVFAGMLILLALTGMFMIKGRKGFVGRGVVLVTLGAAIPIGYLWLSGGP